MTVSSENENPIQKFLFGEMSEEERFEFEERFITEPELFEQIRLAEDELIENYVREWMKPAERSKFEREFLTTEIRRERVEFSRQMLDKVAELKEEIPVVKKNEAVSSETSIRDRLIAFFSFPKFAAATAFTILLAIFGSWFVYQNFRSLEKDFADKGNSNISTIITPTPAISPQDDEIEKNVNESRNFADNSSDQTNAPTNSPEKTPKPTPKKPNVNTNETPKPTRTPIQRNAPTPVLALFAGTMRSGGKNSVLNIPPNAKSATLQLNLEASDYKTYQARLTDANGNTVFQRANLKARGLKINFNVPAQNLKRGDYIIRLSGKNDSGEDESVADFQFRVNR